MRKTTVQSILVTSLFGLTAAQDPSVSCFSGICLGTTNDPDIIASLEGRRPPNATHSVKFKPFSQNETEWTWRVNVTDFPFTSTPPNRHVQFSYDFSWDFPEGASPNLASSSPRLASSYCAVGMVTWGTPANITSKYDLLEKKDKNSPDCAPILGESCVKAIITAASEAKTGCVGMLWMHLPECADTFGAYGGNGLALQQYGLFHIAQSGRPFHVVTSDGFRSEDEGEWRGLYERAVDMLQVVLLRPPTWVEGEVAKVSLNCLRVRDGEVKTLQDAGIGGGGVETGSESQDGGDREVQEDEKSAGSNLKLKGWGESMWMLMFGLLAVAFV
ncbi:hypothetical protein QBC44DRAFT_361034 [Cladorrhinum sp. PSN332]|nr:hypothetical protein QBC44DRAFT_361034 [Cladorrhinum sp. PSN332]